MKKYITLLILTFIFTISCDDYLDVNTDPDTISASQITNPKSILPIAQLNLANTLMGWDFGFTGGFNAQYWTASYSHAQFKSICQYEPFSMSTAYSNLTAGVLTDLKKIEQLNIDDKHQVYSYIAEALSIYTWQIITDVWGDIPYSEAIRGDEGIYTPKFDSGKEIYADLMKRVDALREIDPLNFTLSSSKSDFIFEGDFSKWKLFVNSLKLKLMMRVSETSLYQNSDLITYINSNSFLEESAKISGEIWEDGKEGKRHPMREFEEGGAGYISDAVIACRSFTDYLNSTSDLRASKLFTEVNGLSKGAFFGDFESKKDSDSNGTNDDKEKYSIPTFKADTDIILLSNWEVSFFIAEAYARDANESLAKDFYEKGIKQSFTQHNLPPTIPTPIAWVSGASIEKNIEQIAMQKWVANANYQHIESFLERNRTKYPALNKIDIKSDRNFANLNFPVGDITLSVTGRALTNDVLPQSAIYPTNILNRNTNAPSQKENITVKVWWNKKAQD